MADILLIAGRPGVGKTTLIRRLAEVLGPRAAGFYTEELRESAGRVGFRLVTLAGSAAIFAHVDWARRASHRVGRYGVDLGVLERVGLQAVRWGLEERRVILVDEIGKMELASRMFRAVLEEVASSPALLVATITVAPDPWADAFKRRADVTLLEITRLDRDQALEAALAWARARSRRGC